MDEITFAESFTPSGPPTVNQVLARALAADRAELDQARAERQAEEDRQAARENMALANRQMGDPLGNLTRAQWAVAEARDKVRDLEQQLENARGVLHRAAGEYVDWEKSAAVVTEATARRSNDPDLLAEAKRITAALNVERMLTQRAAQGPRPFAPGGHVVRSEVTCALCLKYGATPEQSFLIHQDPAPEPAPELPSGDELDWLRGRGTAERRRGGYAEITRSGVA